jgi:hypothetical protein
MTTGPKLSPCYRGGKRRGHFYLRGEKLGQIARQIKAQSQDLATRFSQKMPPENEQLENGEKEFGQLRVKTGD